MKTFNGKIEKKKNVFIIYIYIYIYIYIIFFRLEKKNKEGNRTLMMYSFLPLFVNFL